MQNNRFVMRIFLFSCIFIILILPIPIILIISTLVIWDGSFYLLLYLVFEALAIILVSFIATKLMRMSQVDQMHKNKKFIQSIRVERIDDIIKKLQNGGFSTQENTIIWGKECNFVFAKRLRKTPLMHICENFVVVDDIADSHDILSKLLATCPKLPKAGLYVRIIIMMGKNIPEELVMHHVAYFNKSYTYSLPIVYDKELGMLHHAKLDRKSEKYLRPLLNFIYVQN